MGAVAHHPARHLLLVHLSEVLSGDVNPEDSTFTGPSLEGHQVGVMRAGGEVYLKPAGTDIPVLLDRAGGEDKKQHQSCRVCYSSCHCSSV